MQNSADTAPSGAASHMRVLAEIKPENSFQGNRKTSIACDPHGGSNITSRNIANVFIFEQRRGGECAATLVTPLCY